MIELLKILLSLSLSGALLILVQLLCKPLYKNRLSRQWQYYIWLIVVARLLLPFTPETSLVGNLFREVDSAIVQINTSGPADSRLSPETDFGEQDTPPKNPADTMAGKSPELDKTLVQSALETAAQNIWLICVLVWLMVAVGLLIRKITIYQSFAKYINAGRTEVTDMRLWEQLGELVEQAGVKRTVELYTNSLISSPLLIGFLHPCIMLPSAELSDSDLKNTILHELMHYKRRDMFYKWLVQVAICFHWFNPFVYFMGKEINRACEFSCDEAVIRTFDKGERRAYGDTLLNAIGTGGNYNDSLASVMLNENAELLKERLDAVMRFKKSTRFTVAISMVLVCTLSFGATAAGAYVSPKETSETEIVTHFNESIPVVNSQTAISDVMVNAQNCNIIILPSDDANFKYEYDKELFQVSAQIENHSITITANSFSNTLEQFGFTQDTRIRIYIPSRAVNMIDIHGESAGISVLPFNTNINLTNNHGAARVYLDKQFNKELTFVSTSGSGAINMQNEFSDYSFSASVINSPFSPAEGMPGFNNASQSYSFISGSGTASIKLDIQDNAFAIDKYSGDAADLLKTHFDIVAYN